MATTGGIRAGAAYVELFLKNNKFVSGLNQSSAQLKKFGGGLMRIGATVTAAGAAIVGPILAAAKSFAAAGDALDKMSARTSLSVDFLSKLGYAAELGGTSIEAMEKGVRTLQGAASDAADGLATYVRAFDALGVSVKTASGELKPTEELFMETVTALSKMENATKKAALASDIFGRAGTQLLPMLKDGKEGMLAVMEEAKRLGFVLSEEDATAAAELTDAMARVKASLYAVWIRVGGAVADMLTKMANQMAELGTEVIDFVKKNQPMIVTMLKVGAAVVAAGAALVAIGAPIFALGVILGGLASAIHGVTVAFAFLMANPIVLGITAIAVAVGLLAYALQDTEGRVTNLSDTMTRLREEGEKLRDVDRSRLSRLKELSEAGKLSDAQMEEARKLVRLLQGRYGDLGVEVNETTRAINGLADAMEEANARMRKNEVAQVGREIESLQADMIQLQEKIGALRNWDPLKAAVLGAERQIESLAQKYKEKSEEISALLKGLGGDTSDAAPGGEGVDFDLGSEGGAGKLAKFNEQITKRLQSLRIQAIDDEQHRALTAIEVKYKAERDAARALDAERADFARIEEARGREAEIVKGKFRRQAEAEERAAAERVAAFQSGIAGQLARAEIAAGGGSELEKRRDLLELERQTALARAQAMGMEEDQINRLFDLRDAAIGAGEVADKAGKVAGSFSAAAIARLGGGGNPTQKEMAEHLREIRRSNEKIERQNRRLLLQWGD